MICPGCGKAAEAAKVRGKHEHDPKACQWKSGCDCKHGQSSDEYYKAKEQTNG